MGDHGVLGAGVRLLRLPASDRRRKLEALAELVRASLELRLLPASRTVGLLGTLEGGAPAADIGAAALREAELVGRTVARVSTRLPWRPSCLRQGLAVQRMLRRRGIASRLHLGVTNATEGTAHAWVTVADLPVVGRPGLERFVPLAAFG